MALGDFCIINKIELIPLYLNSIHIAQPMDVTLFRPLKDAWRKAVSNWRIQNNGRAVGKPNFAPVLKLTLESIDTHSISKRGFTSCELASLSAEAIDYTKLLNTGHAVQQENTTAAISIVKNKNKDHECTLKFIESSIDMNALQLFIITEDRDEEWHGEEKYKELFSIWLKCRKLLKSDLPDMETKNHSSVQLKEFYFNI